MRSRHTIPFALLFLFVATGASAEKSVGEHIDDPVITARVKVALLEASAADAAAINVETSKGVVQLAGFVTSTNAKDQAVGVAETTEGVIAVSNRLRVQTKKRSAGRTLDDTILAGKVKLALAENDFSRSMKVNIEVRSAVVELSGFVDNYEERDEAAKLVLSVEGVKDVINSIDITQ